MKTPKPKELTQEELFELQKELFGLTFPDDFIKELQQEIDKPINPQQEIPF
jgi:hypothetical protein